MVVKESKMTRKYCNIALSFRTFVIYSFLLFFSCEINRNPLSPNNENAFSFAIYFLQDDELKMKDVHRQLSVYQITFNKGDNKMISKPFNIIMRT